VVVVGASEVVVDDEFDDCVEELEPDAVVDGVVVVAFGFAVEGETLLLAPGSSVATTIPINAAAPVAARTTVRVSRRTRASTDARVSEADVALGCSMIGDLLRFGLPQSEHSSIDSAAKPAVVLL
jgi:hypothetical protein